MFSGKVITFSGIDSAGKSTYIDFYRTTIDKNGGRYKIIWSRGGYTSGCELVKKLTRKLLGKKLPDSGESEKRTEMFQNNKISSTWYTMAILDLIRLYGIVFRIYKLLGYTVIADRYLFDTQIDFSFMFDKDFCDKSVLWKILKICYCRPDLSIFLYVSPETSMIRSEEKQELFSESMDRRVERIDRYMSLVESGVWDISQSTESMTIEECWSVLCDKIEVSMRREG